MMYLSFKKNVLTRQNFPFFEVFSFKSIKFVS